MGLDIRWPIGLMFSLIGAMMVVYGLVTGSNAELYKRSLDTNVNLYWGLLLVAFGASMLIMAWRGAKADTAQAQKQSANKSGEGR
jgi:putative Mn2+ efflux pump MntP